MAKSAACPATADMALRRAGKSLGPILTAREVWLFPPWPPADEMREESSTAFCSQGWRPNVENMTLSSISDHFSLLGLLSPPLITTVCLPYVGSRNGSRIMESFLVLSVTAAVRRAGRVAIPLPRVAHNPGSKEKRPNGIRESRDSPRPKHCAADDAKLTPPPESQRIKCHAAVPSLPPLLSCFAGWCRMPVLPRSPLQPASHTPPGKRTPVADTGPDRCHHNDDCAAQRVDMVASPVFLKL